MNISMTTARVRLELPAPAEQAGGLWYSTAASTRFPSHDHAELELNLVVRGEAHYRTPGGLLVVPAGAVLWLPAGLEHELYDASPDLALWVFSFRVPEAQSTRSDEFLLDRARVHALEAKALSELCALGRQELLRPATPMFNRLLQRARSAAWEGRQARLVRQPEHPRLKQAAALARDDACPDSTAELAGHCGLSRERLSRLFTQSFGISLVQYRNHHRIQRFIRDFADGSRGNMLQVALEVGFGSYPQFYRMFHQVVGYGPRLHLERVRDRIVDPSRTG